MSLGVIPLPDRPEKIDGFVLKSSYDRLQAENAKLRELCKKLYRLADESYVPLKDVNPWMNEFDNAIRVMRELGIEVDG